MPQPTLWQAHQDLKVAAARLSSASVGLQDLLAANAARELPPTITAEMALLISLEQQAPFILGELRAACVQIEAAWAAARGMNVAVAPVIAEAA